MNLTLGTPRVFQMQQQDFVPLFTFVSACVHDKSGQVPTKRHKTVYQELIHTFPAYESWFCRHAPNDTLYLLAKQLTEFRRCCMCGAEFTRASHIRGARYCGNKCYKSDSSVNAKISAVKKLQYENGDWKQAVEDKKIATNMRKLGVAHPMQNPTCFEKQQSASYQSYEYRGLAGLRGYEKYAIDLLLQRGIQLNDIEVGTTALQELDIEFWYHDIEGKRRRYHPDLFIRSTRTFVEVKSDYTMEIAEEDGSWFFKGKSVTRNGFNLQFLMFGENKSLLLEGGMHQTNNHTN